MLDLKLDQMQLEELVLESSTFDDIVTILTSLPQTLKRLKFSVSFSEISDVEKLISALRSIFVAQIDVVIEEIEIQVSTDIYDYVVRRIREEFSRLRDEFKYPTLKKFVFLDYGNRLVLDVLGDSQVGVR